MRPELAKRVPFWGSLPAEFQADIRALDEAANPTSWFMGAPVIEDNRVTTIEYLATTHAGDRSTVISLLIDFTESSISTSELTDNTWNTGYDA